MRSRIWKNREGEHGECGKQRAGGGGTQGLFSVTLGIQVRVKGDGRLPLIKNRVRNRSMLTAPQGWKRTEGTFDMGCYRIKRLNGTEGDKGGYWNPGVRTREANSGRRKKPQVHKGHGSWRSSYMRKHREQRVKGGHLSQGALSAQNIKMA